jgi:hypothetical protein
MRPLIDRPRRLIAAVSVAGALMLAEYAAHASPHETYASLTASFYSSPSRVFAGAGAVGGYRLHFAPMLGLYAETGVFAYVGFHGTATLGMSFEPRERAASGWQPLFGVQATMYFGDELRLASSTQPRIALPFALAFQARIDALRFTTSGWQLGVLGFGIGVGLDVGLAASVDLLRIGYRF